IVGVADGFSLANGDTVIVDAAAGVVTVDPTADEKDRAAQRAAARRSADSAPLTPGALADGTPIALLANLGKPADAAD
ncbi:phosphoenolpyruvate--protein phosphotransferase, partial [Burkholderia sp. SIMBA_024]